MIAVVSCVIYYYLIFQSPTFIMFTFNSFVQAISYKSDMLNAMDSIVINPLSAQSLSTSGS